MGKFHFIKILWALLLTTQVSHLSAQIKNDQEADQIYSVGEKHMNEGKNEDALLAFREVQSYYAQNEDPESEMKVTQKIGYLFLNMRQTGKSIEQYLHLKKLAQTNNNQLKHLEAIDAISTIYLLKGQMNDAISYMRECITLSKELNEHKLHATKVVGLGHAFFDLGTIDSASFYLHKGLKLSQHVGHPNTIALANNYIGLFYHSIGNFEQAKDYYFNSLEIYGNEKDSLNYASSLRHIANIFSHIGDLERAEEYAEKSYLLAVNLGLKIYRANSLAILADIHEKQGNYQKSLDENIEIADIYRISKNTNQLISTLLRIGHILMDLNKEQEAKKYIEEAKMLAENSSNNNSKLSSSLSYGELLLKQGDPNGALVYLKKGAELAKDKSRNVKLMRANLLLANTYEKLGQYKEALSWHRNYTELQDSILKGEQQKTIYELEARYQVDQKEKQIVLLQTQGDNKELKLDLAKRRQYILSISLLGIGAFAALLFFFYKSKQKANELLSNQNSIISSALQDKELLLREIQHRVKNNLQVISSLLSIQSYQTDDPDVQNAVREGKDRVKSMSLIHESLYRDQNLLAVDAEEYIEKLATRLFDSYNVNREKIKLSTNIEPLKLDVDIMIPLGLILNELISNALKYAFQNEESGNIDISFKQGKGNLSLKIKDDGIGLPEQFNFDNIESTGYLIIKDFCTKLKAEVNILAEDGTTVQISIPYLNK